MTRLAAQARAFLQRRMRARSEAEAAHGSGTADDGDVARGRTPRLSASARVDRMLERERLKGLRGHWSYDLNRHIALKRLRDEFNIGRTAEWPHPPNGNRSRDPA